ncbi:MAG: tetratricopeptide repeat protein [Caldilineales bacterium]|nr:tetratricopeptide repeat protein [Caldilineales bacterium]
MSKKRKFKRSQLPSGRASQYIEMMLDNAQASLEAGDYKRALISSQAAVDLLPRADKRRVDALGYLAAALTVLKRFDEAYEVMSEAVTLEPHNPILWHNKGLVAGYTSQTGQALRDSEKALALNPPQHQRAEVQERVTFMQEIVQQELALRGPDFTIEQLIEQQSEMRQAMDDMEADRWPEAEQRYRKVIAMADCLPQPWGNLGIALMMQRRFDEAEAAFNRALEVDPDYNLAKRNLKMLHSTRESGNLPRMIPTQPYAEARVDLQFSEEE